MASAMGMVVRRGREVRFQPYWETRAIANTITDQTYFAALPASADLGNMQVAGQFPAPKQYRVLGFGTYVTTPTALTGIADMRIALDTIFIFTIADKEYFRFPGWMAAGGGGITSTGTAAAQTWVQGGQALPYAWLKLVVPIVIPMQQNFQVRQTWGALVAMAIAGVRCTVAMYGIEERAIQ